MFNFSSLGGRIVCCFFDLGADSPELDSFLLCCGVEKSIELVSENLTDRNFGGSQEHGRDVELNCSLVIELASAANNTTATCEHASPRGAVCSFYLSIFFSDHPDS